MATDVLIIGGGPAGLATANTLARQLHTAIVFDSGIYRNGASSLMHSVPTWDLRNTQDFREAARKDILEKYTTISFIKVIITSVEKQADGTFLARASDGRSFIGRKLVIASGVRDMAPDIEGYEDCWTKSM